MVKPGEITFRRTIRGKRLRSRTDWVLLSRPVPHTTTLHWTDHSDHRVVIYVLEIPNQQPQATHIRFPSSTRTLELCMMAEQLGSSSVDEFYSMHHALTRK